MRAHTFTFISKRTEKCIVAHKSMFVFLMVAQRHWLIAFVQPELTINILVHLLWTKTIIHNKSRHWPFIYWLHHSHDHHFSDNKIFKLFFLCDSKPFYCGTIVEFFNIRYTWYFYYLLSKKSVIVFFFKKNDPLLFVAYENRL